MYFDGVEELISKFFNCSIYLCSGQKLTVLLSASAMNVTKFLMFLGHMSGYKICDHVNELLCCCCNDLFMILNNAMQLMCEEVLMSLGNVVMLI